ncbi:MAG: hypothetical protein ACLGPL_09315 [Acidobacteriota bacterium]
MKSGPNRKGMRWWLGFIVGILASFMLFKVLNLAENKHWSAFARSQDDSSASAKVFLRASRVLLHPRCLNCHPEGDHPLVGDRGRPHPMGIERGPDGMGAGGLQCSGCHQEKNQPGEHSPPGAPEWHLPTKKMPMVFQNRKPRQICVQLKDPEQNGGRNLDQILEHVREAPIVLWGWTPGEGRTPVDMSHEEFVQAMTEWVAKGAACPE